MGNIHVVFFPLLIVMALLSVVNDRKLKRLLLQYEPDFCKSISLSDGMFSVSPATSWKFLLLIIFNVNKNILTNHEVLNALKKAKIIALSYYFVFVSYLILFAIKIIV